MSHVPERRPVRYRTSWMDGQPFKVSAVYRVSGSNTDPRFPYVWRLPTLKDAVGIAKTYRGTNTPVGAGRIQRSVNAFLPGDAQRHLSWMTHEWFVHDTGRIEFTGWAGNARRPPRSPARAIAEYIHSESMEAEPVRPRSTV